MHPIYRQLLIYLFCLLPLTARADTDFSYLTLQGIQTVAVDVEGINKALYRYHFDPATIKKSVEKKLADAGFKIISVREALHHNAASLIKLTFNDIRSEYGFYSYGVDLSVKEKIPLPRRENAFISATIWQKAKHGMMMDYEVEKLQKAVDELIASFLDEYREQNSTKS